MNYLKELNAFYAKLIYHPLSGAAVSLWHILMHCNNGCMWDKEFSVPVSHLELLSGVKGSSFNRAREELKQKGFIKVTSRSGNQSAVYQMISQVRTAPACSAQEPDAPANNIGLEIGEQQEQACSPATNDVNNPQSNLKNQQAPAVTNEAKSDAISFFQQHFGQVNSFVGEEMQQWINEMNEPLVLDAMKRADRQNKKSWGYVKGILKKWRSKNIETVEQAKNLEDAFRQKQHERFRRKAVRQSDEVIPDWFFQQKQERKLQKQKEEAAINQTADENAELAELEQLLAEFTGNRNGADNHQTLSS